MRIAFLMLWLFAGPAFAASEGDGGDVLRLNFADAPTFHGVIKQHFAQPGASDGADRLRIHVSPKVRIALWTSGSMLPARAEVLRPKPPSVILLEGSPKEQITAKTVGSAFLESAALTFRQKQWKRYALGAAPQVDKDEQPSFLQRTLGALFPGD
jgi:hypothetical protein